MNGRALVKLTRTSVSIGARVPGAVAHRVHRLNSPSAWSACNPFRVYRVPPQAVSCVMLERFPERYRGRRMDGDWDQAIMGLEQTVLFHGLRQRFVEGLDWADTDLRPDRYVVDFANAPRKYVTYSYEEFLARGAYLDRLCETLVRDGYRSHLRLYRRFETEMAVNISRDGTLIRNSSGLHRLVLSQLFGVSTVPVRILVTHRSWAGETREWEPATW